MKKGRQKRCPAGGNEPAGFFGVKDNKYDHTGKHQHKKQNNTQQHDPSHSAFLLYRQTSLNTHPHGRILHIRSQHE
jgi:hypothetical protein